MAAVRFRQMGGFIFARGISWGLGHFEEADELAAVK